MLINVKEVTVACKRILEHLEDLNLEEIEVNSDYYWHIPEESLFEFESKPNDLVVGDLREDLESASKIATGKRDAIAFDLVGMASILRVLGEVVVR